MKKKICAYAYKTVVVLCLLALLAGCNSMKQGVSKDVIASEPSVYCTVKSEPNPGLFGHWVGNNGQMTTAIWFGERNGNYAFYFKWNKGPRGNSKWRPNIVDGNTIQNPEGSMKFWVSNGVFYSQFENEKITTYSRYDEKTQ